MTWFCTWNSAERWLNFLATQSGRRPVPCPPENANIKLCGFSADTCVASCRYLRRPMQVPAFFGAVSYVFQTVNLHLLVESARYKVSTNPPNRTIWFVIYPLWFADAAFCILKHPTSVKNNLYFRSFLPKPLHNPNKCLIFAPSVLAKPLNNAQIVRGVLFYEI